MSRPSLKRFCLFGPPLTRNLLSCARLNHGIPSVKPDHLNDRSIIESRHQDEIRLLSWRIAIQRVLVVMTTLVDRKPSQSLMDLQFSLQKQCRATPAFGNNIDPLRHYPMPRRRPGHMPSKVPQPPASVAPLAISHYQFSH